MVGISCREGVGVERLQLVGRPELVDAQHGEAVEEGVPPAAAHRAVAVEEVVAQDVVDGVRGGRIEVSTEEDWAGLLALRDLDVLDVLDMLKNLE